MACRRVRHLPRAGGTCGGELRSVRLPLCHPQSSQGSHERCLPQNSGPDSCLRPSVSRGFCLISRSDACGLRLPRAFSLSSRSYYSICRCSRLRGTSASFLLSDTELTGEEQLPSPVYHLPATSFPAWSLAESAARDTLAVKSLKKALAKARRKKIAYAKLLRRVYTMIALQRRHLTTLNKKLLKKQTKRKDVRNVIFRSGNGAL